MFCIKHLEWWKETLIHGGEYVSPYTPPSMKSLFVSGSFPNYGIIMWTEVLSKSCSTGRIEPSCMLVTSLWFCRSFLVSVYTLELLEYE